MNSQIKCLVTIENPLLRLGRFFVLGERLLEGREAEMHDVALVVLAGAEQVVGVVEPIQDAENPVALVEPKQSYPLDGAQENIFLYNVQQR